MASRRRRRPQRPRRRPRPSPLILEDNAPDVAPVRPSRSRSALLWCVAIVLALGTAGAAAWFGVTLYGERGIPAATAEPPPPSTQPPLPPTPDQQFLTSLGRIGINPAADAAALIGDGHDVCQALGHREPFNQVVADIQHGVSVNSSQANIETSREFAMAAIGVYCPQYRLGRPRRRCCASRRCCSTQNRHMFRRVATLLAVASATVANSLAAPDAHADPTGPTVPRNGA